MRKFFLVVAALGMLATSCTKDDAAVAGGESLVSFTIDSPELATRYGEGTTATNLEWAFYDENGVKLDAISSSISNFGGSYSLTVELVDGRNYTALFWASAPDAPYTVNWDDKKMVVGSTLAANNEGYDAFYKHLSINNTKKTYKVELTRPFAQINIATKDLEKAEAAGVNVKSTKVSVAGYNTLNFEDGSVEGETTFTYNWAPKAEGKAMTDYDMLSMNYVLVEQKELVNVTLQVSEEEVSETATYADALTRTYTTVPVQRNYRTYIVGNLLTTTNEFDITTNPDWSGEHETPGFEGAKVNGVAYATLAEAIANAYDGDVIELAKGEFVFPTQISTKGSRAAERKLKFVGQGEKSVISFSSTPGGADGGLNCYADGLSLSFQDLKIVSPNTGSAYTGGFGRATSIEFKNCTYVGQYRSLNYTKWENCTIDPQNSYIYTDAFNVDFIGCTFNCSEGKGIQVYGDPNNFSSIINITDCTFTAAKIGYTWDSKPVTAIDINSQGEKFIVNIENTTATGFGVGQYSGSDLWNIKGGAAHVTVNIDGAKAPYYVGNAAELNAAIKAGHTEIGLKAGVYDTNDFDADYKTLTLKGVADGVKIFVNQTNAVALGTFDGSKVTFENLTLETVGGFYKGFARMEGTYKNCTIVNCYFLLFGKHVFEGCTFNAPALTGSDKNEHCVWTYGAKEVSFTDCEFNYSDRCVNVYVDDKPSYAVNVKYDNCKFNTTNTASEGAVEINSSAFPQGVTVELNGCVAPAYGDMVYVSPWDGTNGKTATIIVDGDYVLVKGNDVAKVEVESVVELKDALVNAGAAGAGYTVIDLAEGEYTMPADWTPISIDGYHGADIVTLNGNGAVLKGMKTSLFSGGFAGGSGIVIKDLTIEGATIVANNTQGYGAFVNCADSMEEITLINCHLIDSSIITPNDGADESRMGGLVGWTSGYSNVNDGPVKTYVNIKDCSVVGCTLKGFGSIGGICGHAGASDWTYTTIENCTVTGNTLISTDDGSWRVGVVVGTANVGQVTVKNLTESGNTLVQGDKVAPTGVRSYVGRLALGTTGSFVVDGVAITE